MAHPSQHILQALHIAQHTLHLGNNCVNPVGLLAKYLKNHWTDLNVNSMDVQYIYN